MFKQLFSRKDKPRKVSGRFDAIPFDPQAQYAVIRGSICTGERVAGFKNKKTGAFTEVMLIKSPKDEEQFKKLYQLDSVKTEY